MKSLISDVKDKDNVVMHYMLLVELLKLGIEIKTIREVAICDQSPWMKQFVTTRKAKRDGSTDQVYKMMMKLMINSIYG